MRHARHIEEPTSILQFTKYGDLCGMDLTLSSVCRKIQVARSGLSRHYIEGLIFDPLGQLLQHTGIWFARSSVFTALRGRKSNV